MEPMIGIVALKCGHELCPECFAQHSRVNNTCPFCRDEYAPQVKLKPRICDHLAELMIDNVIDMSFDREDDEELDNKLTELVNNYTHEKKIDVKATMYAHMKESARIMYEDIEEYYDENW